VKRQVRKRGPFYLLSPPPAKTPEATMAYMQWLTHANSLDGMLADARQMAEAELARERIFDWMGQLKRARELDPPTEFALDVMFHARQADHYRDKGDADNAATEALKLGLAWGKLAAAIRWRDSQDTSSATTATKKKKELRRQALAEFIRTHGERPDRRGDKGRWYDAFRGAYPEHGVSDDTLKADYQAVRKQQ